MALDILIPFMLLKRKMRNALSTGYDKYEKSIYMIEERGNETSLPFHKFQKK